MNLQKEDILALSIEGTPRILGQLKRCCCVKDKTVDPAWQDKQPAFIALNQLRCTLQDPIDAQGCTGNCLQGLSGSATLLRTCCTLAATESFLATTCASYLQRQEEKTAVSSQIDILALSMEGSPSTLGQLKRLLR